MVALFKKNEKLDDDALSTFTRLSADTASDAELEEVIDWAENEPEKLDQLELLSEVWDEVGALRPDNSVFFDTETAPELPWWQSIMSQVKSTWRYPAGAAVMLMVGVLSILNIAGTPNEPISYATVRGVTEDVRLADGSDVYLNGLSRLEVNFSAEERRINLLEGEAYFKVAPNEDRAFIVSVAGAEIKAIGTAFDIEKGANRLVVTVTEGTISITRGDQSERHSAGTKISVETNPNGLGVFTVTKFVVPDFEKAVTWRQGVLTFTGEPLSVVVERINRLSAKRIAIADPAIADLRVFGSFKHDNIESFIDAMEALYPIKVRESHYRIALYGRQESALRPVGENDDT